MRKIAIIKGNRGYDDDDCEYTQYILSKITDFAEVDDETYRLLQDAQYKHDFSVIEVPIDLNKFICETVEEYTNWIREEQRKEEEARKQREVKAMERKEKKKAKQEEAERILLENLKAKYPQ